MINWQFFPKSRIIPKHLQNVLGVFELNENLINSDVHNYKSNEVLENVRTNLEKLDFQIEKSKKTIDKIKVPVLFGQNGKLEKYFDADGYNKTNKTVIEVEAGRAVTNFQFLKDLFQAWMMYEVDYLVIAVRKDYKGNPDFQIVKTFFETLYASGRLQLPLNGILIIGY
ncbi:MAG: hypothetical protein IAE65_00565 [Ignavibacteria bacterium]|nr:hypothetical protein [Ignavibacteria bacterium]